jgi:hypothetical protein
MWEAPKNSMGEEGALFDVDKEEIADGFNCVQQ